MRLYLPLRRFLFIAVVAVLLSCGGPVPDNELAAGAMNDEQRDLDEPVPYDLDVTLIDHPETPALSMKLSNTGAFAFAMYVYDLPWRGSRKTTLTAVRADEEGTVLKQGFPLESPAVGSVTLHPGDSLSGRIDLSQR